MSDSRENAQHANEAILALRARFGRAASPEEPRTPRWMLPLAGCFAIGIWLAVALIVFVPERTTQMVHDVAQWSSQVRKEEAPEQVTQWYAEPLEADTPEPDTAVKLVPPIPKNCDEARALGLAPAYEGHAGYAPWMDGDHDGISCEPLPRHRRYRVYPG